MIERGQNALWTSEPRSHPRVFLAWAVHSLPVEVGSPTDLQGLADRRALSLAEDRRHTLRVGDDGYSGCMDIGGRTTDNPKLALHHNRV
jgi:hypothetical protein